MMGMKVIYQKTNGEPKTFLRFGQNTLYLQKTEKPDEKAYCTHFAFVIENFDFAKVEVELKRRGLDPKPDSKLAWTITDPDGFRVEIAAPGLPEHIAKDCNGVNTGLPRGIARLRRSRSSDFDFQLARCSSKVRGRQPRNLSCSDH